MARRRVVNTTGGAARATGALLESMFGVKPSTPPDRGSEDPRPYRPAGRPDPKPVSNRTPNRGGRTAAAPRPGTPAAAARAADPVVTSEATSGFAGRPDPRPTERRTEGPDGSYGLGAATPGRDTLYLKALTARQNGELAGTDMNPAEFQQFRRQFLATHKSAAGLPPAALMAMARYLKANNKYVFRGGQSGPDGGSLTQG